MQWEPFGNGKMCLRAATPDPSNGGVWFLTDEDFIPIQKWCEETGIGRRTSWDTFRFKTKADITAFLLRWE